MPPVGGGASGRAGSAGGRGGGGGGGGCERGDLLRRPAAFSEHASVPRLAPHPINQRRSQLYRRVAHADLYPPVLQEAPTWTQAVPFKVRWPSRLPSLPCRSESADGFAYSV